MTRRGFISLGILLSLALGFAIGCAASGPHVEYKMQMCRMNLDTTPSGASVTLVMPLTHERTRLGLTPLREQGVLVMTEVQMAKVSPADAQELTAGLGSVHVLIEKPGFQPYEGQLTLSASETRTHTIALVPAAAKAGP